MAGGPWLLAGSLLVAAGMVTGCLWQPRIDWWTLGAINDSDTNLLVRVELRDGTVAQMRFAAHSLDLMMTLDHPFSGSVSVIDPAAAFGLVAVVSRQAMDRRAEALADLSQLRERLFSPGRAWLRQYADYLEALPNG